MITIESIVEYRKLIEENRSKFDNLHLRTIKLGLYKVYSEGSKLWYDVSCGIFPNGKKFVSCNCIAGGFGRNCKHAMKAVDHHIMAAAQASKVRS